MKTLRALFHRRTTEDTVELESNNSNMKPQKFQNEDSSDESKEESEDGTSVGTKKVRLRTVDSERDLFFKIMNMRGIKKLVLIQSSASTLIFLSQIILYATMSPRTLSIIDITGIGIWGPILFFSTAAGLTWISTKFPSGCSIGVSLGFQIASACVGLICLCLAVLSLFIVNGVMEANSVYVVDRTLISLIILSSGLVVFAATFISIHSCRATCTSRQKILSSVTFDMIETTV